VGMGEEKAEKRQLNLIEGYCKGNGKGENGAGDQRW
jgi:hypothetical protein